MHRIDVAPARQHQRHGIGPVIQAGRAVRLQHQGPAMEIEMDLRLANRPGRASSASGVLLRRGGAAPRGAQQAAEAGGPAPFFLTQHEGRSAGPRQRVQQHVGVRADARRARAQHAAINGWGEIHVPRATRRLGKGGIHRHRLAFRKDWGHMGAAQVQDGS